MSIPSYRNKGPSRFGEKLKELRVSKGMTLKEVAVAVGQAAHGYISELETGKKLPTVSLVIKVADFFQVSTDELIRDELNVKTRKKNETKS